MKHMYHVLAENETLVHKGGSHRQALDVYNTYVERGIEVVFLWNYAIYKEFTPQEKTNVT